MYTGLHAIQSHLSDFNETLICWQILEKYSNVKFNKNPSSESQVVPCRQTDGHTDRHDKANGHFLQLC
jgi:hypothetical protein